MAYSKLELDTSKYSIKPLSHFAYLYPLQKYNITARGQPLVITTTEKDDS